MYKLRHLWAILFKYRLQNLPKRKLQYILIIEYNYIWVNSAWVYLEVSSRISLIKNNNCFLKICNWPKKGVNPLWAELRLYIIFHYFMCFSDVTGPRLKKKKLKMFSPLTVKICRQGKNLTFRSHFNRFFKFLFPICFALIFKF